MPGEVTDPTQGTDPLSWSPHLCQPLRYITKKQKYRAQVDCEQSSLRNNNNKINDRRRSSRYAYCERNLDDHNCVGTAWRNGGGDGRGACL